MINNCKNNLSLLRYFDLKEVIVFIIYIEKMKVNNQIVKTKPEKSNSFKKTVVLIYNVILILMWFYFSFVFFSEVFQNRLDRAAWIPNTYLKNSIEILKYV